jgi:hypothetical protein
MHVRAMFRVLGVEQTYDKTVNVRAAPTYATRDGVQVEENKSFWQATPSGHMTLSLPDDSTLLPIVGVQGAYFYIDLHDPESAPPVEPGAVRTVWDVRKIALVAGGGFEASLSPVYSGRWTPEGGHDNGANAGAWGRRSAHGELAMSINNLSALPGLTFAPGGERRKVVDLSLA